MKINILLSTLFLFVVISLSAQVNVTYSLTTMGNQVCVQANPVAADGCFLTGDVWLVLPSGVTINTVTDVTGAWTTALGPISNVGGSSSELYSLNNSTGDNPALGAGPTTLFCFTVDGCPAVGDIRLFDNNGGMQPEDFVLMNNLGSNTASVNNCGMANSTGFEYQGNTGTTSLMCSDLVPVELVSFTAAPINNSILLDWVSATEIVFEGYELQRSLDGTNFEKIAWIQGSENSLETKQYNYKDIDVKANIIYYYRLKMIDLDESFEYSPIRSAQIGGKGDAIAVYPNPTNTTVNLTIDVPKDDRVSIRFYDTTGKVAMERVQDLNEGGNVLQYNVAELPSGIYRIIIEGQQVRATQNVVVMD